MKSLRLLDRRAGYSLASIGLLLGIVAPTVMPAFASAGVLASRSIQMSSSAATATNATYTIKFTVAGAISGSGSTDGGVLIGFCENSPLLGAACVHPAGFSTASPSIVDVLYGVDDTVATGSVASVTYNATGDSGLKWTANADIAASTAVTLIVSGIDNPTAVGSFYARMTTYADDSTLTGGVDFDTLGTHVDDGSVALSTTDNIGVTAYVLESMTFCVSKGNMGDSGDPDAVSARGGPSINCGLDETGCPATEGCAVAPSMTLGQQNGTVNALDSTHISTGQVYAQLSTNASSGAVVSLKSDATSCGGLYRNGNTANCNIAPKTGTGSFTAGTANFGLTVGAAAAAPLANGGGGPGTGTITPDASYSDSEYSIEYVGGNATGVTSTFGSPIFSSTAPVNNMNVPLVFGASISNTTPAGSYGATLGLVATGTY